MQSSPRKNTARYEVINYGGFVSVNCCLRKNFNASLAELNENDDFATRAKTFCSFKSAVDPVSKQGVRSVT